MAGSGDNPFRQALEPKEEDVARLRPFASVGELTSNPVKADQVRTIQELGIVDAKVLADNPKVAKLTVRDLNDLAAQFSGVPTNNRRIADLTIEDMQDIEGIFLEYKLNTARDVAGQALDARLAVDVSCCCTTPCCCCAAAEVDPVLA